MIFRIGSFLSLIAVSAGLNACAATTSQPPLAARALETCPGGSIHSAQDAARYEMCDTISGALRIERASLTTLDALANVSTITGALVIRDNPVLENLDGLSRLRAAGSLEIRNNPALGNIAGLESLQASRRVSIVENPNLRRLTGLEGLEFLNSLVLSKNGLYSTSGLDGLREVGDLVITQNRTLISLGGLGNLTRARSVRIQGNPRICAQSGLLPRLTRVDGPLQLKANSGLFENDVSRLTARAKQGNVE
ncbi:MAG TPA: hypothetical protein VG937_07650 [Polyangiaceae bacterium]|nr:hypothetical protein [Polyangiaceae bacterium]